MSTRWDLAVYDRNDQLALVVEVKSKLEATTDWAVRLRRNLLAHGTFPMPRYFLMTFPDRFYLWENLDAANPLELSEPTYVIDARPILQPYLDQSGVTAEQISAQSLELIVASWLNEIIHKTSGELSPSQYWLVESGLHGAIVGGSLGHQVAA